jgi:NADPH:quinone reductase-like Zn-dependent oxidoreductase
MRAMRAEGFSGYQDLHLVGIPKPTVSDGRVLVRVTAAGVTPLDHTILFDLTRTRRKDWYRQTVSESEKV